MMNRFAILILLAIAPCVIAQPAKIPAGYSVETIHTPEGVKMGIGGMAFTKGGVLMLSTREGEVWKHWPGTDRWERFADGLHEALGVYIDPKTQDIYVMQRPELTQLIDEDQDGVADIYKTINGGWGLTDNYHEYTFGPVRDSKGNFYGTLNTSLSWPQWARSDKWDIARVHGGAMGRAAPYRGWSFQVTPDGKFIPFSAGLRSPAGIGISKDDEIFYTDNQGDWNASSSLHHVVKGRFHGHPSSLMDHPDFKGKDLNAITVEAYDELRKRPAVWIPHGELANSPGEPRFDYTGGKFGPFDGQMFIGDQTKSNVMRAYLEKVDGEYQGVIFNFIDHLQTGCIRFAFDAEGSLWVGQTGRGWRSRGGKEFGLERIKYDGKTIPFEMHRVELQKDGFKITFTQPVDPATAAKADSYVVEHWEYQYHGQYGSPKVNLERVTPEVKVADDGMSVELKVPLKIKTVYRFTLNGVNAKSGGSIVNNTAWYTLNRVHK